MDFTLSPEQSALRSAARSLLDAECPASVTRARYDGEPHSLSRVLLSHIRDAGWAALTVPEGVGGLGLSVIELALVLEEVGRSVAPVPLWETACLAVPLLREAAPSGAGAAADVLAEIAAGAWASAPAGPSLLAGARTMRAEQAGGDWLLSGSASLVPEAQAVDLLVLPASTAEGPALFAVSAAQARLSPHDSLDRNRVLCDVEVDDVPARLVGAPAPALERSVARAFEEAAVGLAAETLGTSRWLMDATVGYVKVRHQFDVPIGTFQAVQHRCADMLVALERAWSATFYAAMCVAADDPGRAAASAVAKASAGEASVRLAKDAVQLHGGIGYTWEHDLHLRVRRAYSNEPLLGDTGTHRDRLADLLLV